MSDWYQNFRFLTKIEATVYCTKSQIWYVTCALQYAEEGYVKYEKIVLELLLASGRVFEL